MRTKTIAQNIRLKRIYDAPDDDDGLRVLATRYWPRGVQRSAVDEYHSGLAPSRDLIKEYKKGDLQWDDFGRRYRKELETAEARDQLHRLASIARRNTITLMCFCAEEWDCHRTILRSAILESADL